MHDNNDEHAPFDYWIDHNQLDTEPVCKPAGRQLKDIQMQPQRHLLIEEGICLFCDTNLTGKEAISISQG